MATVPFRSPFTLPPLDVQQLPASMRDALCPSDCPLVLLPVRLETRFFALPDGNRELPPREVYPDKIHINSHETELTAAEREWVAHYWEQDWRAGHDERARRAAWPSSRIATATSVRPGFPRHAPDQPAAEAHHADRADRQSAEPARFAPATGDASDETSWRRAPRADMLPDRSGAAVVSSQGRPSVVAIGRDIVRPLAVGPDPKTPPVAVPGDQLAIDAGMRWMVGLRRSRSQRHGVAHPDPSGCARERYRQPVRLRRRHLDRTRQRVTADRGASGRPPLHRRPGLSRTGDGVEQHVGPPRRLRLAGHRPPTQFCRRDPVRRGGGNASQ